MSQTTNVKNFKQWRNPDEEKRGDKEVLWKLPPFGFALFYLRGVAPPSVRTADIYRGVIPFIALQLAMLIVLWFWSRLVTWLPGLVYG